MRTVTSACILALIASATLTADPYADLRRREAAVMETVSVARPATVAVVGPEGAGSGVIVTASGLVLSASHVVGAPGNELTLLMSDGRRVKARSLGSYRSVDAGMAQVEESGTWPFVKPAKSADMELGTWCVALGHPGGYDSTRAAPVRLGRLLEKSSQDNPWLCTDCTLVGGDSGGPLLDLQGRLIGIHSSIGMSLAENRHTPADSFLENWDRMQSGELRGWLGIGGDLNAPFVGIMLLPSDEEGVLVGGVLERSPAEKADLQAGDLVVRVNNHPVRSVESLQQRISETNLGDRIAIEILRDGKAITKQVVVGRRGG